MPAPARPSASGAAGASKPIPARELVGADPRSATVPSPAPVRPASAGEADVTEVSLELGGVCWKVRVRGRSGSSGTRAPPLLLLGFWRDGAEDGEPEREATVVARSLSDLGPGRLEDAFAQSSPPPAPDRKKPFFEGVTQARRGGS